MLQYQRFVYFIFFYAGAYILPLSPPPHWGGKFFQVEILSGEVFQIDTKDMKKKLMSELEFLFKPERGDFFQVCGRINAPVIGPAL